MARFGAKEVMDCTIYDTATGIPVLFLDSLKVTALDNKASTSDAKGGKGNPKLLTWDYGRESDLKITDALMSPASISLLTGKANVTNTSQAIYKREIVTAIAASTGTNTATITFSGVDNGLAASASLVLTVDTSVTFTVNAVKGDIYASLGEKFADVINASGTVYKAQANTGSAHLTVIKTGASNPAITASATIAISGYTSLVATAANPLTSSADNSILTSRSPISTTNMYVYAWDNTLGEQGTAAVTLSLSSGVITASSGIAAASQYVVYYKFNSIASKTTMMKITADAFPGTYKFVGDTVIRSAATGKDESFQMVINKAKFKADFSLTFQADGDPSTFDTNITVLREDANTDMISMIKY